MKRALLGLLLMCGIAAAGQGPDFSVVKEGQCVVLAVNLQYAQEAISAGKATVDQAIAFHNGKIDEGFAEGKSIFTDATKGKALVDGLLRADAALVKRGKVPVDAVGNMVLEACLKGQHPALPNGVVPSGPQHDS